MYEAQKLGIKYLTAAVTLFGVMILFGLLSSLYYLFPGMLYNVFDFSMSKTLHIDTLVIWLLMGLIGAIYYYLPKELEQEVVGIKLGNLAFWVFCVSVALVALTFLFVQYGEANEFSLWFINQGRKYVEAPRWAAVGITAIMLVFSYNIIATCVKAKHKMTGILWVLCLDLVPLVVVYLDAFPADTNLSRDLYWWWWLVHMWVESTWEVLIGCIMAWVLMDVMGTSRRIVETWLYIEVMLVLGAGILGLGHHYFWMVVHAVYDAGMHRLKTGNRPAYFWITTEAFLNFIGAGVWGFMMTLPQINMFSHGTQWTASHGHFAFYGAYVCGIIAVLYVAKQRVSGVQTMGGNRWKWAYGFLNIGMLGMVMGLLLAGMAQAFFERAAGGSTLMAYTVASENPWFTSGIWARTGFGFMFALGYVLLIIDLLKAPVPQKESAALPPVGHAQPEPA